MNVPKGSTQLARTAIIISLIGAFLWLGLSIGEDFIVPTIIVGGALAAYLSKTEVGRALAQRIRHGPEPVDAPEVYGELDELRGRVLELEERLDFAERLLAQPRDAERIPGPVESGRPG